MDDLEQSSAHMFNLLFLKKDLIPGTLINTLFCSGKALIRSFSHAAVRLPLHLVRLLLMGSLSNTN